MILAGQQRRQRDAASGLESLRRRWAALAVGWRSVFDGMLEERPRLKRWPAPVLVLQGSEDEGRRQPP